GSVSHAKTCSYGHTYYTCGTATSWHESGRCQPRSPKPKPKPTSACPANSWTNCGGSSSHAATCAAGHSYWTCGTANEWHATRTCTRCGHTYQKCTNTSTSCQGSRWHIGG
ncbi:MAG: hypothetical protein OXG97_06175, partial [Candidatus Poribacteria bacterium]|nr:hypothetical protein [Candidatus Poribacteria bacterium]